MNCNLGHANCSSPLRVWGKTVFMGRECKERRGQLESINIKKKKQQTSFKNFVSRQTQSSHTKKSSPHLIL